MPAMAWQGKKEGKRLSRALKSGRSWPLVRSSGRFDADFGISSSFGPCAPCYSAPWHDGRALPC